MNAEHRKARQQVSSHVSAGHANSENILGNGGGHFVNTETVTRVGFGERTVPDVHLTRFVAYFVALNADQSKPEVRAQVRPKRPSDTPLDVILVTPLGLEVAHPGRVVHNLRPLRHPSSTTSKDAQPCSTVSASGSYPQKSG